GILDPASEPGSLTAVSAHPATGVVPASVIAAVVLAGVLALGVGWGRFAHDRVAGSALLEASPRVMTFEGQLRNDPSASTFGWSAILDVRRAGWPGHSVSLRESVWVSGQDELPDAVRGDRLSVTGLVRAPNDSGFRTMLERRGIAVEVRAERVLVLGPASSPIVRGAQAFRAFVGRSIERLFSQPESGLLLGLALGDDSKLDEGVSRDFQATGLGHLLVVSGENVAMVLAPILGLAMWLRLSRWPTFALGGGTVLFFVVLTGAEPSVMRAGVMAGLSLFGVLAGRPRSTASILAAAVLILLVLDPTLVWAVGFQLSVVATGGMTLMARPIADRFGFVPRSVAVAAGATIAAQLAVTPILLFYFHEVPVVTIVANVLAFPAVSPALLLGLLAGGLGVVTPTAARPVAALATVPMSYLETLADRLAKAPAPWITSSGGLPVLVIGVVVVASVAWWLRDRRRVPRSAFLAAGAALALIVWSGALSAGTPSGVVVRFFDVGQGDAALVSSPSGANILIDGGPDPALVATKLAALGVKRLDLLVATHPHEDHYIGLADVLSRIPVGLVLDTGCRTPESESVPYLSFLRAVHAEGVPEEHPVRGDSYVVGGLRFDLVSPDRCWDGTNSDPNNDSLVLRLTFGDRTVLFANEPEAEAQQVMLEDGVPLTADVLNVPHHGAGTSIDPFFEAVHERVAVVSVGPNTYGHPVPHTLEVLRSTGARVFRTDRSGDVTITFEPPGMVVRTGTGGSVVFPLG
ncbi:MAG: DNA internalization-related competence protein ComEC/Rec2, partial [Actinomycetota bacterium]